MAGLLQQFEVASDTHEQLQAAISLVLPWNRSGAKGFRVGETDKGFAWIEFAHKTDGDFSPLPYPLDTLPKLFTFVRDWLSSAKRGEEFDTDGSVSEGWLVTQPNMHNCWSQHSCVCKRLGSFTANKVHR